MSAPPFMPFYWSDYFGDTRHLTCEQHGAYLQLLGAMWVAGGTLPSAAKTLARITGCTASRWAKMEPVVLAFFIHEGDTIRHNRLGFELKKAREKSIKRAEVGSLGGHAKALKDKGSVVAKAMPKPCQPEPEPDIRKNTVANATVVPKKAKPPKSRFCPSDWMPSDEDRAVGSDENLTPGEIDRELAKMRDFEFKDPKTDWSRTFRRWLRKAAEDKNRHGNHQPASTRESRRSVWANIAAREAAARAGGDGGSGGGGQGVQLRLVSDGTGED